jgi:hypothetical protein
MVVQPLAVFGAHGAACSGFGQPSQGDSAACSAWHAVEARQRRQAASYLLVPQPDHAKLSGDLAARFTSPGFPSLSPDVVEAIGAHDEGWSQFAGECGDGSEPMLTGDGKPRSFIEFPPADFIRAWSGSIDHAASLSAIGGVLVSRHFASLAEHSLRTIDHPDRDAQRLREFLRREHDRQRDMGGNAFSARQLEDLLRVLQFCDLLSLALCCRITEEVTFPHCFGGRNVHMRLHDAVYELSPSPFQGGESGQREVNVGVRARNYPGSGPQTLTFALK